MNYNAIENSANENQKKWNDNKSYRDNLVNWIFDLKSKTSEKEFINAMDECYNQLRNMDNADFSAIGNDLDKIKFRVSEEIDKYNKRVEENNKKAQIQKLYNNGIENLHNKEYNTAILNFTQYLEQKPDGIGAYYYRGMIYQITHDYSKSVNDLSKYIEAVNNDANAFGLRGWSKYYLKDYQGALSDLINMLQ